VVVRDGFGVLQKIRAMVEIVVVIYRVIRRYRWDLVVVV